jgi:hypothetical protein
MRACNGCKECCYTYTVPAMDKPRLQWCKHACEVGCAIHDQQRPAMCTGLPSRIRLETGQVVALLAYRCATTCPVATKNLSRSSSISKGTPSIFSRSSRDRRPGLGDEGRKVIGLGGFLGAEEPVVEGGGM